MVSIKNLYKHFGTNNILNGINETINMGEKVVVLGPSGCGKSTLLRCLNLLEKPSDGEIWLEGRNILDKDCDENMVRQQVGMVFQHFNLFPHLTIIDNITLAPTFLKLKSNMEAKEEAMDLLDRIGLTNKFNVYPSQLSGGQKQRIAIIRALIMHPKVMLFDEPTSALDPEMIGEVLSLIKDVADSGMTMVIVTHEISFAKEIANKVLFMDNGEIIEKGNPMQFFNQPSTKRAQDFLAKVI